MTMICFWWFRWLGITPDGTYEMLFLPTVFRGLGMIALFIGFGVYVVEDLEPALMLSNAFFLIAFRSVLSPVIAASFFTNMLYYLQTKSMYILSENILLTTPQASERYHQTLHTALSQGHEYGEASQPATYNLYSTLQQQALLLGMKTIIGYMLMATLLLAIVCCFIPFHKTLKVAVVKTGEDMV